MLELTLKCYFWTSSDSAYWPVIITLLQTWLLTSAGNSSLSLISVTTPESKRYHSLVHTYPNFDPCSSSAGTEVTNFMNLTNLLIALLTLSWSWRSALSSLWCQITLWLKHYTTWAAVLPCCPPNKSPWSLGRVSKRFRKISLSNGHRARCTRWSRKRWDLWR